MNDDMPELEPEDTSSMDEILIDDLKTRIEDCTQRLEKKVNIKGEPLTEVQIKNLGDIVKAQQIRLEQMVKKQEKKKAKQNKD